MKSWSYRDVPITDISQFPEGSVGFVYKIINEMTGSWYVGKKSLYSERNIPLGKKALAERTDKRASKKKKIVKESDWKTYMGSNPELKKDIVLYESDNFLRIILYLCSSKKELTYQELRHQILEGCLESTICYNDNILGKFFKNDLL